MKTQKQSRMKQFISTGLDNGNSYRSIFLDQIKEEQRKVKELEEARKS